jgi:uncharacterized protein YaiI (UPF0178 family)
MGLQSTPSGKGWGQPRGNAAVGVVGTDLGTEALALDREMLVMAPGGRERTQEEVREFLEAAGFRDEGCRSESRLA